ncbi:type I DNA topoisomerase [Aurantibacillus circumpalustris]|uniref:type I DNA topoisomerase n=1 Tax=Aurantibacillus circumpalustris TaxID=3036359 RepID=UPI00295BF59F|nr:type I DNA topoisomerase [Aurantibacillus circumpalustris]
MSKNLVIVESPAKAKTIEGFLGKDYIVKSSFGHVRDLVKKGFGIDLEKNFTPTYEVQPDKERVIAELKKLSKGADMVWLASDEDREGEAISWHLFETLGLEKSKTKRIVFHEITKPAIQKAIANPREIDINLVNAQQARRILDRLVGFELSPILWKKIRPSLSAGRVQSVAVRLIVEREREITNFQSVSAFKVAALFVVGNKAVLKAELDNRFKTEAEATAFLEKCKGAIYAINSIETKPAKRTPSAPFTTSTLQQEASRKLGFSVSQTMVVAQRLYEAGKITYMRTDSVNLSETAMGQAKDAITSNYGANYHNPRQFKTKSKGAQEAHEAIRPTYISVGEISGERNEQRLYDLIWKRTIASQMADAELEKTTVKVGISTTTEQFVAQGEVLKFDGFLKVYMEGKDDEDENEDDENSSILPPMTTGEKLQLREITATERFTHHPARYTEASLVKKLEELGIGRPSTYAPTISTVQKRNYVEKTDREGNPRNYTFFSFEGTKISKETKTENTGAEKNKLFPTDIGAVVNDFLIQYFPNILDFNFTARVEEEFDEIAEGKIKWTDMLEEFYRPFHKTVENTSENSERASGERLLGKDPKSGKPIIVRIGRFGPLAQIGETNEETGEKASFASLRKEQSIETITLEDALDLFKLPMNLGMYKEKEVIIGVGRFGPYVKYGEGYISIPRLEDPLKVDMDRAIELIKEKEEADAPIAHSHGKPITKGKGRFGPFIKHGDLFINVPRAYNFDNLSQSDIDELVAKKLDKEANRFIQQWPEEKIALENGRWGPFIRFGKAMLRLPKNEAGEKFAPEDLKDLTFEDVKKMIIDQDPTAFDKKGKKGAAKKASAKKATKKATPKKGAVVKKLVAKKTTKKATVKKAASKKAAPRKAATKKK